MDGSRSSIYGASGSGKSTLMNALVRGSSRLIVFDYLPTRAETAGRERLTEVRSLAEISDALSRGGYRNGFRLWYRPSLEKAAYALHCLSRYLLALQESQYRSRSVVPIVLAIDELQRAFPVTSLSENRRAFYSMCETGRHFRIHLIGATQRPAQVNTVFRGNLERRYFLRLSEPVDLDIVAKTASPRIAEMVARLSPLEYIRQEGGSYSRGRVPIRK